MPTNGETDAKSQVEEKTHRKEVREVFQDAADARINSLNNGTISGFTIKMPLADFAQKKESPTFASANSVINNEVKETKAKANQTKDKQPTTGEKGEVAI